MKLSGYSFNGYVEMESGRQQIFYWPADNRSRLESADIDGTIYLTRQTNLPESLPWGYHRLRLKAGDIYAETPIITAPDRGYLLILDTIWQL